jgi:23S rRNA (uracil1939-C5)-methyltransferase
VLDPPSSEDLARLREFAARHEVEFYLQPGGLDTVTPLDPPAAPLAYTLPGFDVEIRFRPTDFIQVNATLNERAVSHAIELLSPGSGETVLDLFCGLGNFTLPLARRTTRIVGVEGDAELVARARDNAALNRIDNAEFHVADLAEDPRGAAWAADGFDRVLLDPPRAGAAAVLPLVAESGAQRVVYVSCHPGSLARDAGQLVSEHGFRFVSAGVMDMFPHTAHVESIAVFEAA